MDRLILLLSVFAFLPACDGAKQAEIHRLFPDEALVGGVENVQITVTGVRKGKTVKGGMAVTAEAILPPDVTAEQMRPTELAVLKRLKEEFPECEWFTVFLTDDPRMAEHSHWLGMAELREGKLTLQGGVITDRDIADFKQAGVQIWKPTEEDFLVDFAFYQAWKKLYDEHWARLEQLQASGRWEAAAEISREGGPEDKEVFKIVSKQMDIPADEVRKRVKNISKVYSICQFRNL